MNLRRGHALRKRQFRIFHQSPPHQADKQYTQQAANHHQHRALPVRLRSAKARPHFRDHKSRQRKDRARRHALADAPRRPRNVLFKDRSPPHPDYRHPDHRSRIRGRNRNSGAQAQIGIGSSQDNRHHQPQQQCRPAEFFHPHIFGYVWRVLHDFPRLQPISYPREDAVPIAVNF